MAQPIQKWAQAGLGPVRLGPGFSPLGRGPRAFWRPLINEQRRRLQLKPLQILLLGIMMLLTIMELKYKQGETPLFEGDDVGIFSLVGLSLAVYFVTWVALAFTKDFTHSTGTLPILIWHMSCTSGALACGLLSSILVPCYGWVVFFFYALPLWVAPCKPHLRILRRFRPPLNTQQDDHSIAVIFEERVLLHPPTPPFDTQEPSSGCNSFEDPFAS
uniref:Uncharacterized protein n=1 Tax=Vitis vinifera TaxID=29760 RepID=F6GVF5_VITVI